MAKSDIKHLTFFHAVAIGYTHHAAHQIPKTRTICHNFLYIDPN